MGIFLWANHSRPDGVEPPGVELSRLHFIIILVFSSRNIDLGEKPYACPVCPRAFNQRVVLREHIRSHHSSADPAYENTLTPYYCSVCNSTYGTPTEIIAHLIDHSDANTVSKRQPTVNDETLHSN